MSGGNLQEMETAVGKQSKTAVNAGAKAGDPMPKLQNDGSQLASVEDLGGPTPENYRVDDDSAKLREPSLKTVKDIVNRGAKPADPMPKMKKEESEVEDEEVIEAATGTSYADVNGSGATAAVTLPSTQEVAVDYVLSGSATNSGMTLPKLVKAKSILGKNEVPRGTKKYFAITQQQLDDMLNNITQVSSADYAAVKALVEGEVDNFMGFEFIRTELLTLAAATDIRTCFAYAYPGLLCSVGQDAKGRVSERDDKNYATQVYYNMNIGATRMQEEMVVAVYTDESP